MRRSATFAVIAILTLLPSALAAEELELYVTPATDDARAVLGLFNVTMAIALVVFVGVEVLLFYIIWRFRHNKTTPTDEVHRGHTGAEIAWTILPAVILLGIGTVSAVTLFEIDEVPDEADVNVRVVASQFIWTFEYLDGGARAGINELRVEEGKTVRMEVVSRDVEHQLFIPAFALKISAIPGRTNLEYFTAPAPGDYHLECTMYCGFGHHEMGAASDSTKVVVFAKGSQATPYGRPAPPTPPATNSSG